MLKRCFFLIKRKKHKINLTFNFISLPCKLISSVGREVELFVPLRQTLFTSDDELQRRRRLSRGIFIFLGYCFRRLTLSLGVLKLLLQIWAILFLVQSGQSARAQPPATPKIETVGLKSSLVGTHSNPPHLPTDQGIGSSHLWAKVWETRTSFFLSLASYLPLQFSRSNKP